jgi:starch synthase (maltosyl-transferring)
VIGDEVEVEATVYKEGHDLIAARIRYCGPGERDARTAPMGYDRNLDRCRGSFQVDRIGRWWFTVEAWTDRFATWREDLEKKADAGQDTHSDLLEIAVMVDDAAGGASGRPRATLRQIANALRDPDGPSIERAKIALGDELRILMERHLEPDDLTVASEYPVEVDRALAACAAWYEMFPRSQGTEPGRHGTFADAARRLPALAKLGFDVVYLPPIHPIGHSHRKGRNNSLVARPDDPGSPWAIGNEDGGHTAIEPKLGTLEDFGRFVERAGALGIEVALDYALQCSPDHPWVKEHPEWFFIRPDGNIKYAENPPKKYEDIYPLDFLCADHLALWQACRDIFLFWIDHGVKIFRVDNPHTKPFAFWEWVLGEVKSRHPDAIFLSEAFTRPSRMKGLAKLGFTQSYTYFTWRNTGWEIREYLTELTQTAIVEYFRPNFFTNTPDILHEYLQAGGRPAFRVRLVLAATLSPLYGIYSGFELCENTPVREGSEEYRNSEKYEIRVREWDAPGNITADVRRINEIRREHAALRRLANLRFCTSENEQILCYYKGAPGDDLLIVVNLDPHHPQETQVHVPLDLLGIGEAELFHVDDLLTGARYTWHGPRNYVRLDPAEQVAHIFHITRLRGR